MPVPAAGSPVRPIPGSGPRALPPVIRGAGTALLALAPLALALLALAPLALAPLALAPPAAAQPDGTVYETEQARLRLAVLAEGLASPWGLAFLPDGGLLITEKPGRLRVFRAGRLSAPVAGLPEAAAVGQGGLLDVAVDPDYAQSGWVYLSLAARGDGGLGTQIWRGRLRDGRWVDGELLFDMARKTNAGRHFGSRLAFDPQGRLYFSIGDRGDKPRAQDPADSAGRIHRIARDGTVPPDNPFVGQAGASETAFTLGNRNVQGMATHPQTGRIWMHEHGPRGGDEVNLVRAGANYGWPEVTHGVAYSGATISARSSAPGLVDPLHVWVPSIAPSGMTFYSGDKFPAWQGDLFIGALKSRLLVRLELDGEAVIAEERLLVEEIGRIRAVETGPDGHLYLLTDSTDGLLVRLEPAG
ncbi:yliI [Symbiodinium pilosum]|uniref:YliI protein n=2 Tax=Symbiodinium TaxID=2949 RepID=A0A812Q703_SYMPI|nr:yliI [Symbiodinium pilosum]CAE7661062.1 yliI [Symbiodinium necroappetens]